MAKNNKDAKPEPRLPKGLRDIEAAELRQQQDMLGKIRAVYERYGFEPLETPAIEYTDALGKFLPDQDRPNEGVFSFQDEDEQWLSLRYDLTAPLARYVAQNYQTLPKPFRRYAVGNVWRNEKPGPGRFRQFMQFDADTVGTDNVAADAEMCMLAADTLEALGLKRGEYVIKVSNRKVLDGVMDAVGLTGPQTRVSATVLRAIDKLDRLGLDGVRQLLGPRAQRRQWRLHQKVPASNTDRPISCLPGLTGAHRRSGQSMARKQVRLVASLHATEEPIDTSRWGVSASIDSRSPPFGTTVAIAWPSGLRTDCNGIISISAAAGTAKDRLRIDASVVRGLEYYTGPVFEAELTFETTLEDGRPVRFGSVGGGGRYDGLVARFTGQKVPATGFSIGVSRLQAALAPLDKDKAPAAEGPVVVLVMEKDRIADYQKLVPTLRNAGIRAEIYLGNPA